MLRISKLSRLTYGGHCDFLSGQQASNLAYMLNTRTCGIREPSPMAWNKVGSYVSYPLSVRAGPQDEALAVQIYRRK